MGIIDGLTNAEVIASFLSLPILTSLLTLIISHYQNKGKSKVEIKRLEADTESIVARTYESLLKTYLSEVERIKIHVEQLQKDKVESDKEKAELVDKLRISDEKIAQLEKREENNKQEINSLKKRLAKFEKDV